MRYLLRTELQAIGNQFRHRENLRHVIDSGHADPDDVYFHREAIEKYESLSKSLKMRAVNFRALQLLRD